MKISNLQHITNSFTSKAIVLLIFSFFICFDFLGQGEALFKAKCAACHQVYSNGTGPMLSGARKRWADAGEKDLIVEWVKNNVALRASGKSKRAATVYKEYAGSQMSLFTDLSDVQVNQILDWVDAQPDPATAAPANGTSTIAVDGEDSASSEEGGNTWMWLI